MIARLDGTLIQFSPPSILIDVAGVGYEVDMPITDCELLPACGSKIVIYTHLQIKEDLHALYGFLSIQKRDCFRSLIKVSGIGARIALALLSTLNVDELVLAINSGDKTILCRTPGVGTKVAQRMLLELKDKLSSTSIDIKLGQHGSSNNNSRIRNDIAQALTSLGYTDKDINRVMKELPLDIIQVSSGIKEALRLLN